MRNRPHSVIYPTALPLSKLNDFEQLVTYLLRLSLWLTLHHCHPFTWLILINCSLIVFLLENYIPFSKWNCRVCLVSQVWVTLFHTMVGEPSRIQLFLHCNTTLIRKSYFINSGLESLLTCRWIELSTFNNVVGVLFEKP